MVDEFLCEAVRAQDRPREFLRLADAFEASVPLTDRGTLIRRQLLLARTHLLRGSTVEAETAARRALKLVEPTDHVTDHANALLMLADVLDVRDLRRARRRGATRSHRQASSQGEPGCGRPPGRLTSSLGPIVRAT